jgi:hypothetical protein
VGVRCRRRPDAHCQRRAARRALTRARPGGRALEPDHPACRARRPVRRRRRSSPARAPPRPSRRPPPAPGRRRRARGRRQAGPSPSPAGDARDGPACRDAEAEAEAQAASPEGAHTRAQAGSGSNPNAGAHPDAGADPRAGADPDTGAYTCADASTRAGTDTDACPPADRVGHGHEAGLGLRRQEPRPLGAARAQRFEPLLTTLDRQDVRMPKRRVRPVGTALLLWRIWRRLPATQRRWVGRQVRKHGPRLAKEAVARRRNRRR